MYDITKDTYCLYCQEEKGTPAKLKTHLNRQHKGTYAQAAMNKAIKAGGIMTEQREED